MMTSAVSSSSACSFRCCPCQRATVSVGANRSISRTQLVTTLVGATMSAWTFFSSCFTARRSAMVCSVFPRPMSSARTPPEPMSWMNLQPREALLLVGAERGLETARLFRHLDLVDRLQLLEEIARCRRYARIGGVPEELLQAPRLRQRKLAVLAGGGHELDLAVEHGFHVLGVEGGERSVVEPHVLSFPRPGNAPARRARRPRRRPRT